jgi:tRNA 2-selenouridine synthase
MTTAPRVALRVPLQARADYLVRAYADVTADRARLLDVVGKLRLAHPGERIAEWTAQAETGDFAALAEGLMRHHYDPRYEKHRARMGAPVEEVEAATLDPQEIPALAARVALAVERAARPA